MKVTSFIILSIAVSSAYTATGCTYNYTSPNTAWPTVSCTGVTNVCNTTTSLKQSPINVVRTSVSYPTATTETKINTDYDTKSGLKIKNVTHTQQVNMTNGKLTLGSIEYTLAQWHWHQPSEHTFDGLRYDSELHLVHATTNTAATDKYLVIAIYFQIGEENKWLKKNKYTTGSKTANAEVKIDKLNPWEIIKPAAENGVYQYTGSFTTPPCTEGVTFLLTRVPQTMSMAQWTSFVTTVPSVTFNYASGTGNIRPTQAINTRTVYYKYYDFKNQSSLSGGAIAGIVIGSVVGVALIVAICWLLCCKGKKKQNYKDDKKDSNYQTTNNQQQPTNLQSNPDQREN